MASAGEILGAIFGGAAGAIPGIATLNPVLAFKGAAVGGGIGLKVGGAIDPDNPDIPELAVGLPGIGARIENAARQELKASQAAIGARLAASLRGSDIDAASRGVLRSGGQQGRRDDLRIAAIQASAQAGQGIALDKLGLEQRANEAQQRYDLTVAQLQAQQAQATNQLYLALAKASIQFAPDILQAFGVGGGGELGSGDQLFDDDFNIETLAPVSPENFF